MLLSSATTLLVVTRDRVIRASFRSPRDAAPTALAVRERPETDDPIAGVVAALGNDKRSPGRTFVLTSDIWTRTLDMPAGNVANLSGDELKYALAFEAEPLSGLSAAEAATAAVPLSTTRGMQTVWMTQTAAHTLSEIDEVIRGARGKLAGVLHPAGVPYSLDGAASAEVSRVEFWPEVTVRLAAAAGKPTTARVDDLKGAGRPAVVDEWSRQTERPAEVLVPEFRPAADPSWQAWDDEAALGRWLAAWNKALGEKKPEVPLLVPAKRPLTAQQRNAGSLVLAAIALAACFGHYKWVEAERARVAASQAEVEAPGKQLAALQQQLTASRDTTKKLTDELAKRTDEVELAETTLGVHRRRLGELLERLGRGRSQDWVLRKIDGNPREVRLVGLTMHPELISEMAADLARELTDLGWSVEPPEQTAKNVREDGGPWEFSLKLSDQTLTLQPGPAAAPAPPAIPSNVVRMP